MVWVVCADARFANHSFTLHLSAERQALGGHLLLTFKLRCAGA